MKLRKRNNWWISSILIGGLFIAFYISNLKNNQEEESLINHYKLSSGKIFKVKIGGKTADYVRYKYLINTIEFRGKYFPSTPSIHQIIKYYSVIAKYKWLVIYDSTDYENSTMLLQLSDYEKYKIPYKGQLVVDFDRLVISDSNGVVEELGR